MSNKLTSVLRLEADEVEENGAGVAARLMRHAADKIEHLRAELAALKAVPILDIIGDKDREIFALNNARDSVQSALIASLSREERQGKQIQMAREELATADRANSKLLLRQAVIDAAPQGGLRIGPLTEKAIRGEGECAPMTLTIRQKEADWDGQVIVPEHFEVVFGGDALDGHFDNIQGALDEIEAMEANDV